MNKSNLSEIVLDDPSYILDFLFFPRAPQFMEGGNIQFRNIRFCLHVLGSILKHKSFPTLNQMLVPSFFLPKTFNWLIMRFSNPVICLGYNMIIRTAWLMVA